MTWPPNHAAVRANGVRHFVNHAQLAVFGRRIGLERTSNARVEMRASPVRIGRGLPKGAVRRGLAPAQIVVVQGRQVIVDQRATQQDPGRENAIVPS